MTGQARVVHPAHLGVVLQELRNLAGVFANAIHAQGQCFQPLQNQKSVEGADGRAHIAQWHGACTADVGGRAKSLGIDHAVVADFRRVQAVEALFVLGPGELAAINDHAANAGAVPADVFGERVHHDIGAVLEGAAQIGAGHGVVHNQRNAVGMSDFGELFKIGHIAQRVADGFAKNGFGLGINQFGELLGLAVIGKAHFNTVLRQGVGKQVVGAAVERG